MSGSAYNPEIHHRRSVRLKGHDYAGGGLYFVTICAHREFIAFARGKPFGGGGVGATQVSPVRGLIQKRMRITAEKCPFMKWEEAVIMPDHMHVLIRMQGGHQRLGDVIGGFKAAVSRELRRGNICVAPPKNIRIWHRNYHEMIVRTPDVEKRIGEYIRMNPWKLVTEGSHKGRRYRMIGNPSLLNCEKIGLLCSRNCPPGVLAAAEHRAKAAHAHHCFVSGFHSAPERAIQGALLHSQAKIICCPAWGIDALKIPADWLPALEGNRMLIL
ncbi:transposase, partial [Candidatus Bipolaricaulota bacterium]|nr:transposase [Candidatus Bipolaricaulota bacterium]